MSKKMSTFKWMSEKEFDGIKLMQNAGLTPGVAAKISGRSSGTITYVYGSDTFEAYKEVVRSHYQKKEVASVEPSQEPTTAAFTAFESSILEAVDQIVASLANIETALTEKSQKKGFLR